jgi:hypothetical protein
VLHYIHLIITKLFAIQKKRKKEHAHAQSTGDRREYSYQQTRATKSQAHHDSVHIRVARVCQCAHPCRW